MEALLLQRHIHIPQQLSSARSITALGFFFGVGLCFLVCSSWIPAVDPRAVSSTEAVPTTLGVRQELVGAQRHPQSCTGGSSPQSWLLHTHKEMPGGFTPSRLAKVVLDARRGKGAACGSLI